MPSDEYAILEEMGLSHTQRVVYVALIGLVEATVQELAHKTGIPRTTLYSILEELRTRGFVYKTLHGTQQLFTPERPSNILTRLEEAAEEWNVAAQALERIYCAGKKRSEVQMFEGGEGFKKVWRSVLAAPIREYDIITNPEEMLAFVTKGYLTDRVIEQKRALGIRSRQLVVNTRYAADIVAKDALENRVSKFLPKGYPFHGTKIIYGDSVAHCGSATESLMFIVESEEYAESERALFSILWDTLP